MLIPKMIINKLSYVIFVVFCLHVTKVTNFKNHRSDVLSRTI